jgi:hypothetical protein
MANLPEKEEKPIAAAEQAEEEPIAAAEQVKEETISPDGFQERILKELDSIGHMLIKGASSILWMLYCGEACF